MSDNIKFILNDDIITITDLSPNMTLLNYLREHARLTGTKEGCAEGDCGACTVIIGEIVKNEVIYKAVNACILFLPILDGKHIITIEHLKTLYKNDNDIQPLQEKFVNEHASQCGFCTPGFIMSLSALKHNNENPSDDDIHDSLSGNLCRCTGYRPILDAVRKSPYSPFRTSSIEKLQSIQRAQLLDYNADNIKFLAPRTCDELTQLLTTYPDAHILSGGTDIGLWVTKRHQTLSILIYIAHIAELNILKNTDNSLEIGASVTLMTAFDALYAYDDSLKMLLKRFASTQIRNMATIGGNIANGSPIGDMPPALIALDASIVLHSQAERRTIKIEDFFLEYGKQDIKKDEFIEKIIIPKKSDTTQFKIYKISKRFDEDISAVCAAFALTIENDIVTNIRIAYGGMAGIPERASKTEATLIGKEFTEENIQHAMTCIEQDFTPLDDVRASAEYRMQIAQNLLYRFFIEITQPNTETQIYNYVQ